SNLINILPLPHPFCDDFEASSSHWARCTHADRQYFSAVLGRTEERYQRRRPYYSIWCLSLQDKVRLRTKRLLQWKFHGPQGGPKDGPLCAVVHVSRWRRDTRILYVPRQGRP